PPRRPAHQAEFVQPEHRIVPDFEVEPALGAEGPDELGLLLEQVEGDIRMEPDRELFLLLFHSGAPERALKPPRDDLVGEDTTSAVTGRTVARHGRPERWTHALASHLDEAELGDGEGACAGAIAPQMRAQFLKHAITIPLRFHVDEIGHDDPAHIAEADLPGN